MTKMGAEFACWTSSQNIQDSKLEGLKTLYV